MHAFMIDAFETPGALRDVPVPDPGPGELRVRVAAAGVNPIDWKVRAGARPSLPLPRVVGQDFAGIVDAAGPDVTAFSAGDRVLGSALAHGAYAQYTIVKAGEPVAGIPDGIDDATAVTLPTPGMTALGCVNAAGVGAGSTVVIVGAAGAVGTLATQLAAARGAHVIAAVRSNDAERARQSGAERVIDTNDIAAQLESLRSAFPDGISAVIDLLSDGETLKSFAPFVESGGSIVTTVHVADVAWFRERGLRAVNLVMNETPECSKAGLDELTERVADGRLVPPAADVRPLQDAATVLDAGDRHALHGKVVLHP